MKQRASILQRFQKTLRKSQSEAESLLWYHLRKRKFQEFKFRRQHILQGYIVDFVCLRKKLIIELDGDQPPNQKTYDDNRTFTLEKQGFKVLRFWNNEVLSNIESVLEVIYLTCTLSDQELVERYSSLATGWQSLPQGEK